MEAFPAARPPLVTIAASDWALEYLQRTGAKGYLPARVVAPHEAAGRLLRIATAPRFVRRVYRVESVRAVQGWNGYEAAVVASRPGA